MLRLIESCYSVLFFKCATYESDFVITLSNFSVLTDSLLQAFVNILSHPSSPRFCSGKHYKLLNIRSVYYIDIILVQLRRHLVVRLVCSSSRLLQHHCEVLSQQNISSRSIMRYILPRSAP